VLVGPSDDVNEALVLLGGETAAGALRDGHLLRREDAPDPEQPHQQHGERLL
jgi:hypothetical protein